MKSLTMTSSQRAILLLLFLATAYIGIVEHQLQRGSGWFVGGKVYYVDHYGIAYSWEPNYDSWQGFLKGYFPETSCGAIYIGTSQWGKIEKKVINSDRCGTLMSLQEFINSYSNHLTVESLIIKSELPDESTQISMFNTWKGQGLLDDIRYKDVNIYNWSNIQDLIKNGLLIPISTVFLALVFLALFNYFYYRKSIVR